MKCVMILISILLISLISVYFFDHKEETINEIPVFINISGDYVKIDTITKFCNLSGKLYISTDTRSFWREGIRVNYAEYPLRTDEINAVMEILINYRR